MTRAAAQPQPAGSWPERLARGDSAHATGANEVAAAAYRSVVDANPSADVAWTRLGTALERAGHADDAIAAYTRAAQFGAQRLIAEMGLTRIYAQQGKLDASLGHLRQVAEIGVNPDALDRMPALAPLRARPEYAAIRRLAEDRRFPCRNVHTFDFWAGDFDAAQWNAPPGASGGLLHNTREYDGCAFVEHWMPKSAASPAGMSVVYYDADRKAWRMLWVDDGNGSVEFTGTYREGAMRFEASTVAPDGTTTVVRNVLQDVSPDVIRHTFSSSADGGKTWVVQTDERFVRRKPGNGQAR
ncbi:MAG TPA: bacterial transcriptional activator domain-containing protein [Gemmatimonadaceae bacterium]|nr:bacterial transcriptional activator domain-containing protein [Gemmatimonadaceae bacterium]